MLIVEGMIWKFNSIHTMSITANGIRTSLLLLQKEGEGEMLSS